MKLRKNKAPRKHNFYSKHYHYVTNRINSMSSEELLIYYIDASTADKLFLFHKWFAGDCLLELSKRYKVTIPIMIQAITRAVENRVCNYKTRKFEYKLDFRNI